MISGLSLSLVQHEICLRLFLFHLSPTNLLFLFLPIHLQVLAHLTYLPLLLQLRTLHISYPAF